MILGQKISHFLRCEPHKRWMVDEIKDHAAFDAGGKRRPLLTISPALHKFSSWLRKLTIF